MKGANEIPYKKKSREHPGAWSRDLNMMRHLPSGAVIDVIPDGGKPARVCVNVRDNDVRLMPCEPDELIPLEAVKCWRLVTLNLKPSKKEK